jgi:hypothetical protein
LHIGPPLREFRGILTGVPAIVGEAEGAAPRRDRK